MKISPRFGNLNLTVLPTRQVFIMVSAGGPEDTQADISLTRNFQTQVLSRSLNHKARKHLQRLQSQMYQLQTEQWHLKDTSADAAKQTEQAHFDHMVQVVRQGLKKIMPHLKHVLDPADQVAIRRILAAPHQTPALGWHVVSQQQSKDVTLA